MRYKQLSNPKVGKQGIPCYTLSPNQMPAPASQLLPWPQLDQPHPPEPCWRAPRASVTPPHIISSCWRSPSQSHHQMLEKTLQPHPDWLWGSSINPREIWNSAEGKGQKLLPNKTSWSYDTIVQPWVQFPPQSHKLFGLDKNLINCIIQTQVLGRHFQSLSA